MFRQILASQFRRPAGLLGRLIGRKMNAMNRPMNDATIEWLEVHPSDQVLDIGFGGGVSLDLLLSRMGEGRIVGVEVSDTMLARARAKYRSHLQAERLELAAGGVEDLPFEDNRFDRVCSINTVYFWPQPERGAAEIYRVLKPSGHLALAFRPPHVLKKIKFTQHGFTYYSSDEIQSLLGGAGFHRIRILDQADGAGGFACALATKQSLETRQM